jgi:hypothetical protein
VRSLTHRRCPWCREAIPTASADDVATCPRCDRPLFADDGRELSVIDLRFEKQTADQDARFLRLALIGAGAAAGVALVASMMGPAGVAVAPVMVVAHLVAVRWYLTLGSMRLLGPARRFFVRWITRLVFLWGGGFGYGLAAVPVVGVVVAAATSAGLSWFGHAYVRWSLEQEFRRRPLATWEKLVLVGLAVLSSVAVGTALVAAALLGWGVATLLQ